METSFEPKQLSFLNFPEGMLFSRVNALPISKRNPISSISWRTGFLALGGPDIAMIGIRMIWITFKCLNGNVAIVVERARPDIICCNEVMD